MSKTSRSLSSIETEISALMVAACKGDAEAYRELLLCLRPILVAYIRRVLTRMGKGQLEKEEDFVQEVFLALHLKRHTYDQRQPFMPWLFAIARYKIIDYGRQERRRGPHFSIEKIEDAMSTPVFSEPETASDLKTLMESLPEKSRKLLDLVKLEGLSIAEAAAKTQMSESAVKVSIHRAIKTLKNLLDRGKEGK